MRFAEIEGNQVRFVLPPELANDYKILVANQVRIALDADVVQGDIYENGEFKRVTKEELQVQARPAFDSQRNSLFAETQWVRQRHQDRLELGLFDEPNWDEWLKYWQSLRDMPQQLDFDTTNLKFPEKPE